MRLKALHIEVKGCFLTERFAAVGSANGDQICKWRRWGLHTTPQTRVLALIIARLRG